MTQKASLPLPDRRRFLAVCSALGLGQTLLPGALFTLAAQAEAQTDSKDSLPKITPAMIDAAGVIAGVTLSDEQKKIMLEGLAGQRESVLAIRELHLHNATAPAFVFNPVPAGMVLNTVRQPIKISPAPDVGHLSASNEEALASPQSDNSPNCYAPASSPPSN